MIFFPATKPEKIRAELLQEAKRERIQHTAMAEHHKALADMYTVRETRLELEVNG